MDGIRIVTWGAAAGLVLLATACKGTAGTSAAAAPTTANASGTGSASSSASTQAAASPSASPFDASPTAPPSAAVYPSVAASPTAPSTASAAAMSCANRAASDTFAQITAATVKSDGSVSITAHPAKLICGGPDDLHYNVATTTETGQMTPFGTVQMLVLGTDLKLTTVSHTDFNARLKSDEFGKIFQVTGPLSAITTVSEMYHP